MKNVLYKYKARQGEAFLDYLKGGKVKENSFAACIDEEYSVVGR